MKDPGPHPVALLDDIDRGCGASSISVPGLHSLQPILLPAVFFDDCSGTMHYQVDGTGTDHQVDYATAAAYVGLNGLKIQTKQTTPAINDDAYAQLYMPANELPIVRLQLLMARMSGSSGTPATDVYLFNDNESFYHTAQVHIVWNPPVVSYLKKDNGTWSLNTIDTWKVNYLDEGWNHLELAVNVDRGFYHEIVLNGKRLSIPTQPMEPDTAKAYGRHLQMRLLTTALAAERAAIMFDQILVTAERLR